MKSVPRRSGTGGDGDGCRFPGLDKDTFFNLAEVSPFRYAPQNHRLIQWNFGTMHRQDLLRKLARHQPFDDHEAESLRRIEAFVRANADCFDRTLTTGHITGSAWLTNAAGTHVLLTHHRKLGKWLQLGGHADGNPDVLQVAMREAREESGREGIVAVSEDVFDVDVHRIPPRDGQPEHFHYDIRFLLRTRGDHPLRISDESLDLAWVSEQELPRLDTDASVVRMYRKWLLRRASVGGSTSGARWP